ncbi:MAG: glycoside hydrolase family 3 C-terminal domain-containing protein [Candidatus Kapabacteria bacterium]|nr:glycoside hydrolase family 3 C-terminal domain-containing protein [Candidatus Kapabacteria bacterium]
MRFKLINLIVVFNIFSCICWGQTDINQKVRELVSQMTIQEKISLMMSDSDGAVLRLNIPKYRWHNECLHGITGQDVTNFPQCIGLGATFNVPLIGEMASAISDEARVSNRQGKLGLNYWGPNLNIFRDPRWGRGQESYGEDPFLMSKMGVAFVQGMQGDESKQYLKTVVSPKHFIVHSGPEPLRHVFSAKVSQRDFYETYSPAFKAAFVEGKAHSLMTAYTGINGIANSLNKWLLDTLLRKEWGFDGFITTDCGAISDAYWGLGNGNSDVDATRLALEAGCDLECTGGSFRDHLKNQIDKGILAEFYVDSSVSRLLRFRYRLGLFDDPGTVPYNSIPDSIVDCQKHKEMAIKVAQEAIVLLKNDKHLLPIKRDLKKYFVIGPLANVIWEYLSSYAGGPSNPQTFLQYFKKSVSSSSTVTYTKGCEILGYFTEAMPKDFIHTDSGQIGFIGEYFNNKDLSGKPDLIRNDTTIDFNWNINSPAPGIKADSFSVRWTGNIKVNKTAFYCLKTIADDGVRLYIDSARIINDWIDHSSTEQNGFAQLDSGKSYKIKLEYYDNKFYTNVRLEYGTESMGQDSLADLTKIAKENDVVIYLGGISNQYESENIMIDVPGFYGGDRTNLELSLIQSNIIKALYASGKPVIFVVFSGGGIALNWEKENIPAILQAWYPGQAGAEAITSILLGDCNPSGKLPITFYRSVNDLPEFTNYSMDQRTYRYFNKEVLFPFGYGLSYTTFDYSKLTIPKNQIDVCKTDSVMIKFQISNSGMVYGGEVVQLYIRSLDSKFPQPIKSLKGFKKIFLSDGESKLDSIMLNIKDLAIYDTIKRKFFIESGRYEIQIGSSSADIRLIDTLFAWNCLTPVANFNQNTSTIIYPNPVTNYAGILFNNDDINMSELKIYNLFGEEIDLTEIISQNNSEIKINCTNFSNGVYFIKIKIQDRFQISKFIVNQ